jgi:hypothetical protein
MSEQDEFWVVRFCGEWWLPLLMNGVATSGLHSYLRDHAEIVMVLNIFRQFGKNNTLRRTKSPMQKKLRNE